MSDPEHALTDRPKAEPSSAPSETEPAGLTAETVPRSFNWGAFLSPTLWCIAMREWLWMVPAATVAVAPAVKGIIDSSPDSDPSTRFAVWGLAVLFIVIFGICPFWISLFAGFGFIAGVLDRFYGYGGSDRESLVALLPWFVYWLVPLGLNLYLGFVGNRLAARGRRFDDARGFTRVQRRWRDWGFQAYPASILIAVAVAVIAFFVLYMFFTPWPQ